MVLELGFKKISVKIFGESSNGNDSVSSELFQSIKSRLKSTFYANVLTNEGEKGRFMQKYKLLSKLNCYEV